METSDQDGFFALCFLTSHPGVILHAVTVTLGTKEQIGIVRHVLELTDYSTVLVGSRDPKCSRKCVSEFHYKFLGRVQKPDGLGYEILHYMLRQFPNTTVVTGAPLQNLRLLLENYPDTTIKLRP